MTGEPLLRGLLRSPVFSGFGGFEITREITRDYLSLLADDCAGGLAECFMCYVIAVHLLR